MTITQKRRGPYRSSDIEVTCPICGGEFWQRATLLTPRTCSSACGQRLRAREADPLTERETQALELLVAGLSTKDIAARLEITTGTVSNILTGLYRKLDVANRAGAIAAASHEA